MNRLSRSRLRRRQGTVLTCLLLLAFSIAENFGIQNVNATTIFSDGQAGSSQEINHNFSAWTNTYSSAGDTITVQTTHPHHGSYTFQSYTDGSSKGEYAYAYKLLSTSYKTIYVRAYFYFANNLPIDSTKRNMIMRLRDGFTGRDPLFVVGDGTYTRLRHGGITYAADGTWGNTHLQTGKWYCIEFARYYAPSGGWRRTWLNGNLEIEDTGLTDDYSTSNIFVGICYSDFASAGPTKTWEWDCVAVADVPIGVEAAQPPIASNVGTNSTVVDSPIQFCTYWTANEGNLSTYIFGTNNTGVWVNETASFSAGRTGAWSNITRTLNRTIGVTVGWEIWANNTSNVWGNTGLQSLITVTQVTASYVTVSSVIAGMQCTFTTEWTTMATTTLSTYIFGTNNTGIWVNETASFTAGQTTAWSNVTKILNEQLNCRIEWRIWTNNTSNIWGDTGLQYFITDGEFFGNDYAQTSATLYYLDTTSKRLSYRFTTRAGKTLMRFRVPVASVTGTSPTYNFGIQADSGGYPSGTYLRNVAVQPVQNYPTTAMWYLLNITSIALTSNTPYHIVIQYHSGSISRSNHSTFRGYNQILKYPYDLAVNKDAEVLYDSGTGWTLQNESPTYILDWSDSTYEGQPYGVAFAPVTWDTYSTMHTGEQFLVNDGDKTISVISLAVRKVGTPADNLVYSIYDVTTSQWLYHDAPFATPSDVTTSVTWINRTTTATLINGHAYRVYWSSHGSLNAGNCYQILYDPSWTGGNPPALYTDLSYGGSSTTWYSGANDPPTETVPDADVVYRFTLKPVARAHTITASAGTGGSITPSGAVLVTYGEDKSFTITPDVGYIIFDVLVDGASVGAVSSYTFTAVSADHTISASFTQIEYTLSVTVSPDGSGSVSKNPDYTDYHYNDIVQLTAAPSAGYTFSGWSGDLAGSTNPASLTITGNMSVTATFTQDQITWTITASAGTGGSIDPIGAVTVANGTNQLFTVTPDPGYAIADVVVDSVSQGAVSEYTFIAVSMDHTIVASFIQGTYTITASVDGIGGTIDPSGDVLVNGGEDITFTITPDTGYHVLNVMVDGVYMGPQASFTFYSVDSDHIITSIFAKNEYSLTIIIVGPGKVSIDPNKISYSYGDVVQIAATPNNSKFKFDHWEGDLTGNTNPETITIDSNKTVYVYFIKK